MALPTDYDPDDPSVDPGTGPSTPPPSGAGWQVLRGYTLNNTEPLKILVLATFKQSFSSGGAPWACRIVVNGVVLDRAWGELPQDKIGMMAFTKLQPGSNVIALEWQAAPSVSVYYPSMVVDWRYK